MLQTPALWKTIQLAKLRMRIQKDVLQPWGWGGACVVFMVMCWQLQLVGCLGCSGHERISWRSLCTPSLAGGLWGDSPLRGCNGDWLRLRVIFLFSLFLEKERCGLSRFPEMSDNFLVSWCQRSSYNSEGKKKLWMWWWSSCCLSCLVSHDRWLLLVPSWRREVQTAWWNKSPSKCRKFSSSDLRNCPFPDRCCAWWGITTQRLMADWGRAGKENGLVGIYARNKF